MDMARTLFLAAAIMLSGLALGQDGALEEIIVTGSRIARPDFESASPIVSITQEAFERTGSTSVETTLNRMPQLVPTFTSTSNNPANGGQGNLNLRGLGPVSTLVLIDGRRLIPANGTGVVDVNIIPAALVESVEIITGGASAVYGSDAIAGVVNFKLKDNFEGLQFDGGWAVTEQGDGEEYSAGITGGFDFADGRGQVLGYAGYSNREAITYDERDFSSYSLAYFEPGAGGFGPDGGFLPSGSTFVLEGRPSALVASRPAFDALFESYGFAAGTVPYQSFFGVNQDGSLFTTGNRSPGSVVNFRGERDPVLFNDRLYTYNFAPWNYLQLPLERVSAFAAGSFELDAGHELYARAMYADYSADQALAPPPSNQIFVPANNPYISDDLRFLLDSRTNPAADLRISKRFSELGARVASNQYDVYQLTAGVSGPISDRWTYDAYVQYGDNDQAESQDGNALRSRINELTYAPDGGQSICGEFNIFLIGRISPECAQYISASGTNRSGYEQTVIEASASGTAMALPAGDLRLAVGVMHKRDEYFYHADPIASVILDDGQPDIVGFNASDDIDGSDYNTDLYIEALVPLLADLRGAERLELVVGYRYSDYDSAGGADAWKAELLYQPVTPLRLRASLQRAVRAPSVFELYSPRLPTGYSSRAEFGGITDPCEAGSAQRSGPDAAQVEALCAAQGVPAELLPDFEDQDFEHLGVAGGNPKLDPETGDTLTVGFVWTSPSSHPLWSGMQVAVDWYRIEVEDAIEQVIAPDYIPWCFDPRTNPGFEALNRWCEFFSRDALTGEIVGFTDILYNIDGREVSGADLQFDWSFAAGPGDVGFNALVSWMDTFKVLPPPGLPEDENVGLVGGLIGGSFPEWKASLQARYQWAAMTAGLQWRYVDSMRDASPDLDYPIPSFDYFDLFATYVFDAGALDGLTFRAGVENLTDEDPPLLPSQVQANTDPSQYDVLGRRYYFNVSYRF
jgi:outer membrane receptor protein involved in Fe transport